MGLLERYEAGAFEDVYRQLKTEPKNAEAGAVASTSSCRRLDSIRSSVSKVPRCTTTRS
jgi:hypothetical protein